MPGLAGGFLEGVTCRCFGGIDRDAGSGVGDGEGLRGGIATAGDGVLRGGAVADDALHRVLAGREPGDVGDGKGFEASDGFRGEVGVVHLVSERPGGRGDKGGAIHRMGMLSQVDDLRMGEPVHVEAAVGAASGWAKELIEVGSVFSGGYPYGCTFVLSLECGSAGDLADIADGLFVRGGVPEDGLPFA